MQSVVPLWRFQSQSADQAADSSASDGAFQGARPLDAHVSPSPLGILRLELPGLTDQLRMTLQAASTELAGYAYQLGDPPCGFKPVSWARWMELMPLKSLNAAKTRLARLEAMGLLEVQAGRRGPWGMAPNRYRLRWANDGLAASHAFDAALRDRTRQMNRKCQARKEKLQLADTPGYQVKHQPADTPLSAAEADTPSSKETELNTSVISQSVSQLRTELNRLIKRTDGLIELIGFYNKNQKINQSVSQSVSVSNSENKEAELIDCKPADDWAEKDHVSDLNLGLKAMLKATDPSPWPELLLQGLGRILDPLQVAVIEERSPWSADGAWAILGTISTVGRNLCNQPGTLWNALLYREKGARWLAMVPPAPSPGGGRPVHEPNSLRKVPADAPGEGTFRQTADSPLPQQRTVMEEDGNGHSETLENDDEDFPYIAEEGAQESEEPPTEPTKVQMVGPEDFSPDVKAELRASIETFRKATRAALHSPAANRPGGYDDFSRCWKNIVDVLEPMLPLQVNLPDEYRPVAIRQPSQIKMNVVEAVYRAVS